MNKTDRFKSGLSFYSVEKLTINILELIFAIEL